MISEAIAKESEPLAGNLKFSSSVVNIDQRTGLGSTLRKDRIGLLASLEWTVVGTLAILVVLGLALRLNQLGAIGFAEDEMNKLDAVRAYENGDFSANAEHPMVMKVPMTVLDRFRLDGRDLALTAFNGHAPGTLSVLFTDQTSGRTTYAATSFTPCGRYAPAKSSISPIVSPPTSAPGIEPKPPRTAAAMSMTCRSSCVPIRGR